MSEQIPQDGRSFVSACDWSANPAGNQGEIRPSEPELGERPVVYISRTYVEMVEWDLGRPVIVLVPKSQLEEYKLDRDKRLYGPGGP